MPFPPSDGPLRLFAQVRATPGAGGPPATRLATKAVPLLVASLELPVATRSRPRRTATSVRRSRAGRVLAATAGLAVALSGCSATNQITTRNDYAASDGVRSQLGDVVLGNLIVLTSAEGEPGTLLGSVTNRGQGSVEVTLAIGGSAAQDPIDLDAGQTVILGPDQDVELEIDSVPAPPGAFVDVFVSSDQGGTSTVGVPVLDGTLPEYADLVPAGS